MAKRFLLLIEPVWNRNSSIANLAARLPAFNRTSMESKRLNDLRNTVLDLFF